MVNLILAGIWGAFGVGVIVWSMMRPEPETGGSNLSLIGLMCLMLAFYNLMRWWFRRPRQEMDWHGRTFPPPQKPRVVDYNPELDFEGPPEQKSKDGPAEGGG